MPKFNVYYMSPMCNWENVEAENEDEAISQCSIDSRIDVADGPFQYYVEEVEEET